MAGVLGGVHLAILISPRWIVVVGQFISSLNVAQGIDPDAAPTDDSFAVGSARVVDEPGFIAVYGRVDLCPVVDSKERRQRRPGRADCIARVRLPWSEALAEVIDDPRPPRNASSGGCTQAGNVTRTSNAKSRNSEVMGKGFRNTQPGSCGARAQDGLGLAANRPVSRSQRPVCGPLRVQQDRCLP